MVWLVSGEMGAYIEEYETWFVAAWPTEREADEHAEAARKEARRIDAERQQRGIPDVEMWRLVGAEEWARNRYDPTMRWNWSNAHEGPLYGSESVPFAPEELRPSPAEESR